MFVVAWIAGWMIGPSPPADAGAAQIATFYAANRTAALASGFLIDGVAGVGLLILAVVVQDSLTADAPLLGGSIRASGIAAGTTSLVQGMFGEVLYNHASSLGSTATTLALFDLQAEADTFKLLAIGVLIFLTGILLLRTRKLPSGLAWFSLILGPAEIVGGWSFYFTNPLFTASLDLLLPLLLIWVALLTVGMLEVQRASFPIPPPSDSVEGAGSGWG